MPIGDGHIGALPCRLLTSACAVAVVLATGWALGGPAKDRQPPAPRAAATMPKPPGDLPARKAQLRAELKKLPHKIVFESFRGGNWDLLRINADGSGLVHLTRTPKVHEMYPHASADGTKICFVADEGRRRARRRNIYYMNADGAGRTLVARNAYQPCWGPAGKTIAYAPGEYDRHSNRGYATKGVAMYDLSTGKVRPHPNDTLHHLYALCWSPDWRWLLATVEGAMGYKHADLAIEASGTKLFPFKIIRGCRPDVSPDGKKVAWNATDQDIFVADLDLSVSPPKVTNPRVAVSVDKKNKVYHADWSPDGGYLAFSGGPEAGGQCVGVVAKGWNIYVADPTGKNVAVRVTTGGVCDKEPDWLPVRANSNAVKRVGDREPKENP